MKEILHPLIGSLSLYLQGFIHPGGVGFLPSTLVLLTTRPHDGLRDENIPLQRGCMFYFESPF